MTNDIAPQASIDLTRRLAAFGFAIPLDETARWSPETSRMIEQTTLSWEADYNQALQRVSTPAEYRSSVPRELAAFETIPASIACQARDLGRAAATSGASPDCNPYPPATALSAIWRNAFLAAHSCPGEPGGVSPRTIALS